jgi:Phosphoribosyltransferase
MPDCLPASSASLRWLRRLWSSGRLRPARSRHMNPVTVAAVRPSPTMTAGTGELSGLIATHRSVEVGHTAVLERIELEPLVALDLPLGEGSGAELVLPILDAAAALLDEMATFREAGVASTREPVRHLLRHTERFQLSR